MSATESPIPFLDLGAQNDEVDSELEAVWKEVRARSGFIGGDLVEQFENAFADYCGTPHAIGVANGTDALMLILRALGIGPGDEVLVPANTFVATAEAVGLVGATPVFVDVDPATLLVTGDHLAAAVTPRTAAAMIVHLYGQMPDMDAIAATCTRHGLAMVEDAAQAQGAAWRGRRAGSVGVAAGFSFYPGKNLGALGDAGAVTTSDAGLAERIRTIAGHGTPPGRKYEHPVLGTNSRLDALQAGFLTAKLARLDDWNEARRHHHATYLELLPEWARPVAVHSGATPVHHLEVVRVPDRDAVAAALAAAGIGSGIHYPIPCHQVGAFGSAANGSLPVAEAAAGAILSLPMFPHLRFEQIERVSKVMHRHGRDHR